MNKWGKIKGIDLLATGDFTHPMYLKELKEQLVEDGTGFLTLKETTNYKTTPNLQIVFESSEIQNPCRRRDDNGIMKFILSGEISCIYKDKGKTRRLHHLIYFPDFVSVEKFNKTLTDLKCNLRSDGRPIIGLTSKQLLQIVMETTPRGMLIPAHVWTPWFAIFGSKSGYDSIEECFEELSSEIFAIETGLSSDPAMNWRVSALDRISFISNSDAHSPAMLGREANVFEFEEFTYDELRATLKGQDQKKFLHTIEFYPQEGKYHADGHATCKVCLSPAESLKNKNLCPVCKKELVLGVEHRVADLADREVLLMPSGKIPFKSIIPLPEIIAEILSVNRTSKKVQRDYESLIEKLGSEFSILLDWPIENIRSAAGSRLATAIDRMRQGNICATSGYDGIFGKIKVFSDIEKEEFGEKQKTLF